MNNIYSIQNRIKRILRDSNKWSMLTLTIIFFIAIPIITIFINLFNGTDDIWQHVVEHLLLDYLSNSALLIIGCGSLTLLFGISSAWFISRYEFPFRKLLEWLLILPLAIPSYITAYAYAGIFDYGGSLQTITNKFDLPLKHIDVLNIYGLIGVLSLSLFPYVYVSARAVFIHQSRQLIEASNILGASERKTFFRIILPLARPAIIGGLILVLMEVLNDYGAAQYFGVSTFTTGIFRSWFALESIETAIYLSAILIVIIFILISIEKWQRKHINYASKIVGTKSLQRVNPKAKWKIFIVTVTLIPALFGFVIPVLQLFYWLSFTFNQVYNDDFINITFQSIGISLASAFFTTMLAFFFIYFSKWNKLAGIKSISKITTLGYAIPGAIIAIGVMLPSLTFDKYLISIYEKYFNQSIGFLLNGTIIALVYAYMVRFFAVAFNPLESSTLKIGKSLSESSRLLGKSAIQTLFKIELPLLKTGFLSAFILVFIDVMKELPLTLILKPYNVNTLAVKAYEYASDEMIAETALPSLVIISVGVFFVFMLNKLILK